MVRLFNEKNPMWKGNKVGRTALHNWVKRRLAKSKFKLCQICNINKSFELINLSGKYKRNLSDWKWACRSCHNKYDKKIMNLLTKIYYNKCVVCKKKFKCRIKRQITCSEKCRKKYTIKIGKLWKRNISKIRKSKSLCIKCGKRKYLKGIKYCKKCKNYSDTFYFKNAKLRKEKGLCIQCGKRKSLKGVRYCSICKKYAADNYLLHKK